MSSEESLGSKIIRATEAAGQRAFVASDTLPIKFNSGTKQELEAMGVRFAPRDSVEPNALFIGVMLPEGWRKVPTPHSMWSKLLDDKGRERASIFYKAAFYDRDAFINVSRRFNISPYMTCDAEGRQVKDGEHTHLATVVLDCETVIHVAGVRPEVRESDRAVREAHHEIALAWLKEHYPDWESNTAYWD